MRRSNFIVLLILVVFGNLASINSHAQLSKIENEQSNLKPAFRGNGLRFAPNKGQVADCYGNLTPDVLYKGEGGISDVYLRKAGVSYVHSNMDQLMREADEREEDLEKGAHESQSNFSEGPQELKEKYLLKIHRVDMNFDGCNKGVTTINEDEIEGYSNYYYPHCPKGVTGIKKYSIVTCKNIYDNIDVTYFGNVGGGLKYNIVVNPGGNSDQVQLHWVGAEELSIVDEKLRIKTSVNEFNESIPKVYQNINGKVIDLKARYTLRRISKGEAVIGFAIEKFNPAFPLVIDPWVTYFGPSSSQGRSITTDNAGNSITAGTTTSLLLPVSAGAFQTILVGGFANDAFVVKFSPAGNMLWSTYYGGSGFDRGLGIAADSFGNIAVTGSTDSANFPVTPAAFQTTKGMASGKAFVIKFNSTGLRQWATYYGGTFRFFPGFGNFGATTVGNAIAIASNGDIAFTGDTETEDFPVTLGAPQLTKAGGINAFVAKLDGSGMQIWSTYYGGSGSNDTGKGIAIDNANNVVVFGSANSVNFPVVSGIQMALLGNSDAFLLKLNAAGNVLWATYYGGTGFEAGYGVCLDSSNNIIITGATNSLNFPLLNAQQSVFGGNTSGDAFLAKLSPLGLIIWSTYLGGSAIEYGWGVATDVLQNVYVYGDFEDFGSGNYPISSCAYQTVFGGGPTSSGGNEDQFIAKYSPNGIQRCITYMGGTLEDDGESPGAIAVYGNVLYITGYSYGNYPVTSGAYQTTFLGTYANGFIDQLCINLCEAKTLIFGYSASVTKACPNTPIIFTPTVGNSCDTTGYRFRWTFAGGTPSSSDSVKPTVSFSNIGTHDVKLVISTVCKKDSLIKPNYIEINSITGLFTKGTANCTACGCKEWLMVNGLGGVAPYTYSWPNGYNNRYQNNLCPGDYTINIKDKNGCSINVSVTTP